MNKGLELNGRDAEILISSSISRMVVEGYDTSPPRKDVEEALKKHFASRGIKLVHVCVPVEYGRCALIYVNGEREAETLKLDGSDMGGGRFLHITPYPFDDNSLDHVFAPISVRDKHRQHTLKVTGLDTSLSRDDVQKMLRRVFPGSSCTVLGDPCSALLHLRGQYALDEVLKLSGGSVEGFKFEFAVTEVLLEIDMAVGITFANHFRNCK